MRLTFFCSLICFYISGCKSPTSPTVINPSIIPLAVGNQWVMQTSYFDTLGNLSSTSQDTIKVIGDTIIQGQKYYVMLNLYALTYMSDRNDGIYVLDVNDYQSSMFLKYPAVRNDSYSLESTNYSIASTDTMISVPKGNFHCYQYSLSASGINIPVYDYYSPGIGYVQQEFAYLNKPLIGVRRQLVDYSLK